jgi:7,8-dihydroneopterin aldolase/epimerase/oxygenase
VREDRRLLPADKRVMAARVRVEKPDIIPNARSVGVEIERQR